MPTPSNDSIRDEGEGQWVAVSNATIERVKRRVLPQYAGMLIGGEAPDYETITRLHCAHSLWWLLKQMLDKGGLKPGIVNSAAAGEVSVSYGGVPGVNPQDPGNFDTTVWGQELRRLRQANGSFSGAGKSGGEHRWRGQ